MRLPTLALLVLLALAVAVLLGLGTWQVQRHGWKQGVIEERAARLAAPPLEAPAALELEPAEVEGHRVRLRGVWDHAHTMVLANRIRYGLRGEELVTPLVPEGGGGPAVLVNRGWYPESERARVRTTMDAEAAGDIEGLAFDASGRSARQTTQGTWTALDPASMGKAAGTVFRQWAVLQGTPMADDVRPPADGALPVQRYRPYENTTPHLQYAITWYGIAAVLIAIAVARFILAPRRARRMAEPE